MEYALLGAESAVQNEISTAYKNITGDAPQSVSVEMLYEDAELFIIDIVVDSGGRADVEDVAKQLSDLFEFSVRVY